MVAPVDEIVVLVVRAVELLEARKAEALVEARAAEKLLLARDTASVKNHGETLIDVRSSGCI